MAKRKSTKKSTSSRKKTSSRKTSSKSRALPQGYTRAAYSSKLALDALIKKGFISKSATLTEMLAYPQGGKGSKTAAVNELIESYSIEYPSLFGKGSAHQALAEHYSKSKSGASVNKLIDKLIEEGKIVPQEGVYKEQDNPLLRSLKGLRPQMAIGQQTIAENALMRPAYSNILTDNPTNFKRFAEPFLKKDNKGNIIWSSVDDLIKGDDTAAMAGPARLAMTRLWQVVKGEVLGLKASYQFQSNDSATLTENQKAKLQNLQSNIGSLVGMFGGVDITAVSDGIETQTPVPQTPGTFTRTVGTVDLSKIAAMPLDTVKNAKDFLAKANIFASSKGNFLAKWMDVSNQLAKKQSDYNKTLLNNVIQNIDIVPQETIITLLRQIAQDIGKARAQGTLDSRDYAKYERRFNELIRGAKSIPTMAKLVELAGASNDPRVSNTLATKKYAYDILVKKIQKFQDDISSISDLKGLIDRLKTNGTTKKQFIERLQSALDRANDMSKLTEKQKNAILNGDSGALTTKENYQKAVKAVQKLRITLQRVRSARTEQQARTEIAYLTLGIGDSFKSSDLKTGLETAFSLGDTAIAKDFTSAVKEQKSALSSVQSAAYQDKQYMAMFFVDPMNSINLKPFSSLGATKKTEMNTVAQATTMVNTNLGNISACRIQVPDTNDPREVLKRLPSSIRSMGNDQVKARANAATRFIAELSAKHQNVIGLLKNLYSGGPSSSAQNLYEANLADLKQTFNGVNYDKGLRQNASVGSKGFHVCALVSTALYTPATNAPKAILKHGDLVWFPVFRGDTLYLAGNAQRTKEFSIGVDAQGNPIKYKRQNDDGILTRRFGVNNLGQEFTYKWNPVDAEMLRVRYFVSLYPFSLTNSRFNQIYREELAVIKDLPKPGATGASRQQAGNFILGLFS